MTTLLQARALSFGFGDSRLIHEVSLTGNAGELVVVVGPNGAGKSTLLRLFAGDLTPQAGSVVLNGSDLSTTPIADLALQRSYLSQQLLAEIPFTVREVVAMGRHPHRDRPGNSTDIDAVAVSSAIDSTDVGTIADRVFTSLSGGEAQRVHLARVLAQQTPVTLLDEPTAALDIAHQELVMTALRRVAANSAVVAVLHDLNLGAVFADRLVLLDHGTVVGSGTPRQILVQETLSEVYRQPIRVIDHPYRDAPLVLPVDRP